MKKLVLIRHGDYVDDMESALSPLGVRQITGVANLLRGHINGDKAHVLFSTRRRATQSAEIIQTTLGLPGEPEKMLAVCDDSNSTMEEIMKLVRAYQDRVDVLVLVGHMECCETFPEYFSEKVLGLNGRQALNGWGIKKGQAWVIDCQAKTMEHLKPAVA